MALPEKITPATQEGKRVLIAEAAKELGCSTTKVWMMIHEGGLRVYTLRGDKRKKLVDLDALKEFANSTFEEETRA